MNTTYTNKILEKNIVLVEKIAEPIIKLTRAQSIEFCKTNYYMKQYYRDMTIDLKSENFVNDIMTEISIHFLKMLPPTYTQWQNYKEVDKLFVAEFNQRKDSFNKK